MNSVVTNTTALCTSTVVWRWRHTSSTCCRRVMVHWDSSGRLSGLWHHMHWTLSLPVSYTAGWTTATLFLLVYQLATFNVCSPFLTQPYVWSPAHRDVITDHVTSLLRDRHWLPVKQRVEYKLCTIVHRCLYGDAPSYLVDLIKPSAAASARVGLRSAELMTVAVPCMLSSLGDRSFATTGPRAWNKLPSKKYNIQSTGSNLAQT